MDTLDTTHPVGIQNNTHTSPGLPNPYRAVNITTDMLNAIYKVLTTSSSDSQFCQKAYNAIVTILGVY